MVSVVNAQNTSRGAKSNNTSIANYNFTKALSAKENNKEIVAEKVVSVSETASFRENTLIAKTATSANSKVAKPIITENTRVCQSQPINIRKTVTVQY